MTVTTFQYTAYAQQVIFGAGELKNLAQHIAPFGPQRVLLCTSGSYVRNGTLDRMQTVLGEQLCAHFAGVRPHVPDDALAEALALGEEHDVDAVIGLGGGSAVGMAKAVSLALEARRTGDAARARHPADQPLIPVIAIPTTYAGSEMSPIYGVTAVKEGRKQTVTDAKVTPKLTVYDPELTLDLPAEWTAATGVNALAHCVEGVYSITRSPVTTATALAGISHIARALPRCVEQGDDLAARTEMLTGAYLAGTTIANAKIALHHGICHVLGGTAGLPHGVANSIMLPHAMRFNLSACAAELATIAPALNVDTTGLSTEAAAEAAIEATARLIGTLGMPRRLRDAGVAETDLPRLATVGLKSRAVQANPLPITEASQLETLLRAAW